MEISSRAEHKYIDISRLPPYIQQLAKKIQTIWLLTKTRILEIRILDRAKFVLRNQRHLSKFIITA